MKITVLGSGSIMSSCNSASFLIDNDTIIDLPNGACKSLMKLGVNPVQIENVLITHFHGDHFFDIPFYMLQKSKSDNKTINIYCSSDGKNKNNKLLKLAFPNSANAIKKENSIMYCDDETFSINEYKVNKILVNHGRMKPAYGYILSNKNKKVGFTGDTTICKNVLYMASICDYLFCDCTLTEGTSKHMGIDMFKDLCSKYENCKFVACHMADSTRDELLKEKIKNVIIPKDGTIIEID